MRKHLRILMMAALAAWMVSPVLAADDVTVGDLTYNFYTSGSEKDAAYVTGMNGDATSITIPSRITYSKNGKDTTVNVLGIGDDAFAGNTTLEKVSVERSSYWYIGARAFKGCTGLKYMNWTSSSGATGNYISNRFYVVATKSIGESAFEGCTGIAIVYTRYSNVVEYGKNAFKGCTSMTAAYLYATTIKEGCFADCTALKTIYLYKLTELESNAFANCTAAGTLYFLDSTVPSIADDAFSGASPSANYSISWQYLSDEYMDAFGDGLRDNLKAYINFSSSATVGYTRAISCKKSVNLNSSSLTVYYVSSVTEGSGGDVEIELVETPSKVLPNGQAVIVAYTGTNASSAWSLGILDDRETTYENYLVANLESSTLPASDGSTNYYTYTPPTTKGYEGVFKQTTAATALAPGFAYLKVVDGQPTGIKNVVNEEQTVAGGAWFNINGMRMESKPTQKGIYIHNGKKVVIK